MKTLCETKIFRLAEGWMLRAMQKEDPRPQVDADEGRVFLQGCCLEADYSPRRRTPSAAARRRKEGGVKLLCFGKGGILAHHFVDHAGQPVGIEQL